MSYDLVSGHVLLSLTINVDDIEGQVNFLITVFDTESETRLGPQRFTLDGKMLSNFSTLFGIRDQPHRDSATVVSFPDRQTHCLVCHAACPNRRCGQRLGVCRRRLVSQIAGLLWL